MVQNMVQHIECAKRTLKTTSELNRKALSVRNDFHEPVTHDDCPKITAAEARIKDKLCNQAGYCVHGKEGHCNVYMRSKLNTLLTLQRFRKGTPQRKLLENSSVSLCCIGRIIPPVGGHIVEVAAGGHAPPPPPQVVWLHLGVQEFRPIHFSAHLLESQRSDPLPPAYPCRSYPMRGTWEYKNTWTFVRMLNKDLVWTARFFRFERSHRKVGRVLPAECTLDELPICSEKHTPEMQFWGGNG